MLLSSILSVIAIASFAQCVITGPSQVNVGETVVFSVPSGTAQCAECYDWDINNSNSNVAGNVQIIGNDQYNTVSVLVLSAGPFTIKITYFDETGCHICELDCNRCDINQEGVTFVNAYGSEYLTFYAIPVVTGVNNFNYSWTFTYQNGAITTSNDKQPAIPAFCSNRIVSASVVVTSSTCSKTINQDWSNFGGLCGTYEYAYGRMASNENIKLYPNPVKSMLGFRGKNLYKYKISIFDQTGLKVMESLGLRNINVAHLKKGTYHYTISDSDGYRQNGVLLKE
jgi:Secretion system C-terminal sorting domain